MKQLSSVGFALLVLLVRSPAAAQRGSIALKSSPRDLERHRRAAMNRSARGAWALRRLWHGASATWTIHVFAASAD